MGYIKKWEPDELPSWMPALLTRKPACFDEEQWGEYLVAVALHTSSNTHLKYGLQRGRLPNYCLGCTRQFAERMAAKNKCRPPHPADLAEPMHEEATQ